MLWQAIEKESDYNGCLPFNLTEGILINAGNTSIRTFVQKARFQQICAKDNYPLLRVNNHMYNQRITELPEVQHSWKSFTQTIQGGFNLSAVSIIFSLSSLAVMTWFMSIFVATNYTMRPSLLMWLSTGMSSVFMLVAMILCIIRTHNDQKRDYIDGQALVSLLHGNVALSALNLISVFFLQINQVQVAIRLLLRQSDKRLTFVFGLIATLVSQVLWGVTMFYALDKSSDAGDVILAFIYLVRLTGALCYAAIVTVFILTKIKSIMVYRKMWLLTAATVILVYSPVAFFFSQAANSWSYDVTEMFTIVSYDVCVVMPWAWCSEYNEIKKEIEKEGVLGRRFFEDEWYELDGSQLFSEGDYGGPFSQIPHSLGAEVGGSSEDPHKSFGKGIHFLLKWRKFKVRCLRLIDLAIEKSMSVPQPGLPLAFSINTPGFHTTLRFGKGDGKVSYRKSSTNPDDDSSLKEFSDINNTGTSSFNGSRDPDAGDLGSQRDVFVYRPKNIVIESSESDEGNDDESNNDESNNEEGDGDSNNRSEHTPVEDIDISDDLEENFDRNSTNTENV